MAGRMWGWLLICDPPEQTAGDIADALQASRGAISGTARILSSAGIIRRSTRRGRPSRVLLRAAGGPRAVHGQRWSGLPPVPRDHGAGPRRDRRSPARGPGVASRSCTTSCAFIESEVPARRSSDSSGTARRGPARRERRDDRGHPDREADQVLRRRIGASSDLDLEVQQGEIFGFLGPNGAGKTTTMRVAPRPHPAHVRARRGLRHRDDRRPGGDPPPRRLPARRVRPVRPADRRARRSSTSRTSGAASTPAYAAELIESSTSTRAASSRSTRRATSRRSASSSPSSTGRTC